MIECTFQLESDYSLAVVVAEDYRRAFDIVAGTCPGQTFWLVEEKPAEATDESITLLKAK